jgi:NAD(P)-dependent dehydrogenase (short-subunit alcohol dehydrogenase family)
VSGRCDILVNNAGISGQVPFDDVDEALWRRFLAANRDSQFYLASKTGVIGFTRGLSADVAQFGITVNAVGPTASKTPGGLAAIPHIDDIAQLQAIRLRAGIISVVK